MSEDTNYIIFSICRSVFHGNQMSDADKQLVMDNSLVEIIQFASKHDIAHLVAFGLLIQNLKSANLYTEPYIVIKEQIMSLTVSVKYLKQRKYRMFR